MSRVAKTARPAVGVWRTSNSGETGGLVGRRLDGSSGREEDMDDDLERLVGDGIEGLSSMIDSILVFEDKNDRGTSAYGTVQCY